MTTYAPAEQAETRTRRQIHATRLPNHFEGRIEPGRVFDRVTDIEGVPDGYPAMNDRVSIKVMVEP